MTSKNNDTGEDSPSVELYSYNPDTGEETHITDGEIVEPDLSLWRRTYYRFERARRKYIG